MGLHLDVNYPLQDRGLPAGRRGRRALRHDLARDRHLGSAGRWRLIRRKAPCPIASLESVLRTPRIPAVPRCLCDGRGDHRRDLERVSGIDQDRRHGRSLRSELRAAQLLRPPLLGAISAHFCAVVPNFRVMEIDIDSVAVAGRTVHQRPAIENGELMLPKGPGWGVEVNEAAVRDHPPR